MSDLSVYEPYPDSQPLAGEGSPPVETIVDLIRYCTSIHSRFGDTCVEVDGTFKWGGTALNVRSEKTKEIERLTAERKSVFEAGFNAGFDAPAALTPEYFEKAYADFVSLTALESDD